MMIPRTNPAASQVACYYTHVAFIKKIEQNMSILQLTNPTLLLDWLDWYYRVSGDDE